MAVNASTQEYKKEWMRNHKRIYVEEKILSCGYKQNLMQVMSLSLTATLRLIYCLSNIVKGKTYIHKRLTFIL